MKRIFEWLKRQKSAIGTAALVSLLIHVVFDALIFLVGFSLFAAL